MGESYRGLTIRIGADTSTLQKALRGVNSAIGSTQSELRKVKQALNFDPSGVRAAAEGMQLASNRAAELHQKLNTLRRAEQQLAGTDAGKRLASQMYDAQAAALKAKNEYNDLNAALERVKRGITSATKGKVDLVGTDPSEIDKVVEGLAKAKGEVGELAREYQRLKSMWSGAAEELDTSKQAAQLQDLRVEIARTESQLKGLEAQAASFAASRFGNDLKAQMQDAVASMRMADTVADQLKAELSTLDDALRMDPSSLDAARLKMQNLQQQAKAASDRIDAMQRQMSEIASSVGADRVAADFAQAQNAVQEATAELQRMDFELAQSRARMNQLAEEAATLRLKGDDEGFKSLNAELEKARANVKQLADAQQAAQRSFETANAVAEYRSLETQVARTKAELQQLNTTMQGSESKAGASFSAMTTLGLSFYSTLTPAVQQFGSYAVQSANDIDTAYRSMRKTVQGTEYQFEQLLDGALEFSQSNFASADTLLSIEAMGGQLGIATENLDEFAKTAANLDIATDLDAEEISTAMGQLSGIMTDLTADKFPSFGDALVRLGNNAPAVESSIVDITKRIGSMGSIVGFSTPELLAWATAIASTGQNSEAAGTAISKTMSDIEQATAEGGDKLQTFADVAGMSADEFAAAWESSPSSAMQAFVDGLKDIDEAGGSVDATLAELDINEVRQKQALQGLTQTVGDLNGYLQMSEDAWGGVSDEWGKAGDAAREAGAKSEGFSGQLQILKNNAQVLSAEMAGALVPLLETAIDVLQDVTTWFRNLSPEMQNLVVGAIALSGALGPVLTVLAAGGNALSQFKNNLMQGRTAFDQVANSMKNYSVQVTTAADGTKNLSLQQKQMTTSAKLAQGAMAALKGVMSTIGWTAAVVGITTLVTSLADAKAKADQFKKATDGLVEASLSMGGAYETSNASVTEAISGAEDYAMSVSEVNGMVADVVESQAELADSLSSIYDEAGATSGTIDAYQSVIERLAGRSNLSASELAQLETAIDGVNDACGTNYSVVEDFGGAYQIMADGARVAKEEILKLIEAQKLQMLNEAAQSGYQETLQEQGKAAEAAAQAEKTYQDALANKDERIRQVMMTGLDYYTAQNRVNEEIDRAKDAADSARATYDSYGNTLKNVTDYSTLLQMATDQGAGSIAAMIAQNQLLTSSLAESGKSSVDLAEDLSACGVNAQQFGELSSTEVSQLAGVYDGTFSSISGLLQDFGIAFDQASADAHMAMEAMATDSVWLNQNVSTALMSALDGAGMSIEGMSQAFADAGMSLATFGSLTSEQLAAIVAGYDGTAQSISNSMYGLVVQAGLAGTQASQQWYAGLESGSQLAVGALALMRGYTLEQLQGLVTQFNLSGTQAISSFCSALSMGAEPAAAAAMAITGITEQQFTGLAQQVAAKGTDAVTQLCQAIANGADPVAAAMAILEGNAESSFNPDLVPGTNESTSGASSAAASGDTSGFSAYGDNAEAAYEESFQPEPPTTSGIEAANAAASSADTSGFSAWGQHATDAINQSIESIDIGGVLEPPLQEGTQVAETEGTNTGQAYPQGVSDTVGQTQAAAQAHAEATTAMNSNVASAYGWGSSMGANFASGLNSQVGNVSAAASALAAVAAGPLHHSTPKFGPLHDDDVWGAHMAENFADGILSGTPKVARASLGIAQTVADYIGHTQPAKGPLSVGEWVFGWHTAINYADGLYSGADEVASAAGSVGDAAKDELEDADAEFQAYIDEMIASYRHRGDEMKEISTEIADYMWNVWAAMADDEWVRPFTGNVYESMKAIEEAGYDLDSWKDKLAQAAEEQVEWQRKLEDLDWDTREQEKKKAEADEWDEFDQRSYDEWMRNRQDTLDEYAEWLAEFESLKALEASLTASTAEMEEWADLYKMKSDVASMTDESERLADALWNAGLSGATFSQEFIDYIADNGPEAVHALEQLTDLGEDQLQQLSDSFRDAALAEREAEINMRSLYVNSLKYTDFETQSSRLLDYRETVLDVREAMYSDSGLSHAFEMAGVSAEGFALDLESVKYTMEDFQSYQESWVGAVSNGFSQMTKYEQTSLEEWAENLKLNMAEAQDWSDNLQKVFATLGAGEDVDAFRQAVLEGGFDQWGKVIDEMAGLNEEQMRQYVDLFNEAMKEAQLSGIEAFQALAPGEEYVNSIVAGILNKQEDLDGTMVDASDSANDAMLGTAPEWYSTGSSLAHEIAAGIQSQISAIADAAAQSVRTAIEAARQAAGDADQATIPGGGYAGSSMAASARSIASAATALSAMPAMASVASRATQAVRSVTNNNQTVNMTFNVTTRPGQTVDVRELAKEINKVQERAFRARGNR